MGCRVLVMGWGMGRGAVVPGEGGEVLLSIGVWCLVRGQEPCEGRKGSVCGRSYRTCRHRERGGI